MNSDEAIEKAVRVATREAGESEEVATVVWSWFRQVAKGNEKSDLEAAALRLEQLMQVMISADQEQYDD